jgi:hypothetical protein
LLSSLNDQAVCWKDQMLMLGPVTGVIDNRLSGQVELEATTKDPGTTLRAPTAEAGLVPACKDSCFGELRLRMWERRYDGSKGKVCYFSILFCL